MKDLKTTGVFAGLRIPESYRGRFILCAHGAIAGVAASPAALVKRAQQKKLAPVVIARVPNRNEAIMAY